MGLRERKTVDFPINRGIYDMPSTAFMIGSTQLQTEGRC